MLSVYEDATTGVDASDNATQILGEESEPQPDLALRILAEYGGQSRVNDDEYYEGAPELIAEIAHSSHAIDMNQKHQDYEQAGVQEYLVLCIEEPRVALVRLRFSENDPPRTGTGLRGLVFFPDCGFMLPPCSNTTARGLN